MSNRIAFAAIAASLALSACGSTGSSTTSAQAPVVPGDRPTETVETSAPETDEAPAVAPWAPAPWTSSFHGAAVMLANSFRIEGPEGLLEHVVASSDDAYYDRSVETTPDGLMQVIRRVGADVPEIRVQVDGWTLAAFDRVTILERVGDSPVRIIASGDALWRDADGRIAQGQRIECVGEIGDDTPAIPEGATEALMPSNDSAQPEESMETEESASTGEPLQVEEAAEPAVAPATESPVDSGTPVDAVTESPAEPTTQPE